MLERDAVLARLRSLPKLIRQHEKEMWALVEHLWPAGTWLTVRYGNGHLSGVVQRHYGGGLGSPRVRLRLDSTGRDFWIAASWLYREDRDA